MITPIGCRRGRNDKHTPVPIILIKLRLLHIFYTIRLNRDAGGALLFCTTYTCHITSKKSYLTFDDFELLLFFNKELYFFSSYIVKAFKNLKIKKLYSVRKP